jgi:hypothetical protein
MENIKLVKIGNTIKKKNGSLDDILTSSSKIRDIINKKKTLKSCRYLEKTDFTNDEQIIIQKPEPIKIEKPQPVNFPPPPKPKKDLKSYGENLEKTTLSKRKKTPNKPKSKSIPITNFFNKSNYKPTKTKKYNRHEIKYIINSFKKMYYEKDFEKLIKFINKLNRDQTVQILYACNVVNYKTDAPIPLLKNIVFNIVLGNIQIMR